MKKVSEEAIAILSRVKPASIWVGDNHVVVDNLSLLDQICRSQPSKLELILETPLTPKLKNVVSQRLQKELVKYRSSNDETKFLTSSMLFRSLYPDEERNISLGAMDKDAKFDIEGISRITTEIAKSVYSGGGHAILIGGRPNIDDNNEDEEKSNNRISKKLPIAHSEYGNNLGEARKNGGKNMVIFSGISHVISYSGRPPGIINADGRQYIIPKTAYGLFEKNDVGIAFTEIAERFARGMIEKKYFQAIETLNETFRFFSFPENKKRTDTASSIVFILQENKAAATKISDLKIDEVKFSQDAKNPVINKGSGCIIM